MLSSRRTVVRSAAWAAPVILASGAAPAFALSPARLFFDPILAEVRTLVEFGETYFELYIADLKVTLAGDGTPANVVLTITFEPDDVDASGDLYQAVIPVNWESPDRVVEAAWPALVWTTEGLVSPQETVVVPPGVYFGVNEPGVTGTFLITATASGYESDDEAFPTGPLPVGGASEPAG